MEEGGMNPKLAADKKGVTLIELLVALVISGVVIAGIYRVFTAQTRAYTVQEQAVDVQQNIRSVMEIMLRDIRMSGYKPNINPVTLATSIFPGDGSFTARSDAIRVEYQRGGNPNTVVYSLNVPTSELRRDLFVDGNPDPANPEVVLRNVNTLSFTYGVDGIVGLDTTQNGAVDDQNGDGIIDDNDCLISATAASAGNLNIIAIRIALTAAASNPNLNPDIANIVPRNLVSTVNLRNLCLIKDN
jgi:prepilin-type N-terminal cleavage/methylation domain-containing protein